MVIRFNNLQYREAELRDAVYACYAKIAGADGFIEDGVEYTPFTLKEHIYLLDNYDLYIDDDFNDEIAGMFIQALRGKGFLEEKAQIIVPKVYKDRSYFIPPVSTNTSDADEDDNIERFEDHLPDSAWDDGKYREEIYEIYNNPDLYKD